MADDYRRHKMDFSFLPSLLSDVGRAKTFVRPTTSEKINTGLGAVFNFVEALEQDRQMEMVDQQKLNHIVNHCKVFRLYRINIIPNNIMDLGDHLGAGLS
mgnify:CR=1 FL=1